jgi:hypothetical protein
MIETKKRSTLTPPICGGADGGAGPLFPRAKHSHTFSILNALPETGMSA